MVYDKPCRGGERRAYGVCVRKNSPADHLVQEYQKIWINAKDYHHAKSEGGAFIKAAWFYGDHEIRKVVEGIRREDFYGEDLGLPTRPTDLGGVDYSPGWQVNTWRTSRRDE